MLGLVAFVLVLAVGLCWYELSLLGDAQSWVTHTYRVLRSLERMESTIWDAETNQRGYLITGNSKYFKAYEKSSRLLEFHLGKLSQLLDEPEQNENLKKLKSLIRRKADILEEGVDSRRESGIDGAIQFLKRGEDQEISNRIRAVIADIEKNEKTEEMARIRRADQSGITLLIELAVLSLVSIGLFAGMALAIKRFADEKQKLSLIDEMTGVYNRRGFLTLVGPVLRLAKRQGKLCSLIFVDMDGLKPINDNHGHEAGNQAIIAMSEVLRESFRGEDIVARWGGDEFVIFAFGAGQSNKSDLRANFEKRLAKRIEETKPPYKLSASLGIISIDPNIITLDTLAEAVHEADMNMYNVKKEKKQERR